MYTRTAARRPRRAMRTRAAAVAIALALTSNALAQASHTHWEPYKNAATPPSVDQQLTDPVLIGAIDLHAHYGPDSYPRQWDAFEIAALAQARGLRGIVLKNHWSETAGIAYLVRKYGAQGIEVFGAVTLDTPVGGREPTGRSLHGGRHGRLGPHRVDADSRLRARGRVQQGAAALRPRFSRRRAAARGPRGASPWWPSTGSRWRPGT